MFGIYYTYKFREIFMEIFDEICSEMFIMRKFHETLHL